MAQNFLVLDRVDVRRSGVAGSGRPNIVAKFVIPPIRMKNVTRTAGGGVADIDYVQYRLQAIEPAATIHGFDSDLLPGVKDRYTLAASLRIRKTGLLVPLRCEIEGIIAEWAPDEGDPAQFNGCNSTWKEVTHFELTIDGQEWWYVDEDEGEIRRMGKSLTEASRRALGS